MSELERLVSMDDATTLEELHLAYEATKKALWEHYLKRLGKITRTDETQACDVSTQWGCYESDHSDPLELVKLFLPKYLPEGETAVVTAKKAVRPEFVQDWEVYFEKNKGYKDGEVRFNMNTFFQEAVE